MVEVPSLCRNIVLGTNNLAEYCGNFRELLLSLFLGRRHEFVTPRSTNPRIQYCSLSTVNVHMAYET